MSSFGSVIECYNNGLEAKREMNFFRAVRSFRMYNYHYEEEKLPCFVEIMKKCGENSASQQYYRKLLR